MTPTAKQRARDVLGRLPAGKVIGAEVGVWRGYMSAALLSRPDLHLYMVDNWKGKAEWPPAYQPQAMLANRLAALEITEFAEARRTVLQADSVAAAERVRDKSLDFVFIDADHSYDAVRTDIEAWKDKLKPGGLLGGHDYANNAAWGMEVKQAVDEAVEANGWVLGFGCQTCWYVTV